MDTILSGSVPIFTDPEQYRILGDWIDWSKLTYYLQLHDESDMKSRRKNMLYQPTYVLSEQSFLEKLQLIIDDEDGYERKHKAVIEHAPLFDYTTIYPFDTYMYLFQAKFFPETRQAQSKWNALKLPRLIE